MTNSKDYFERLLSAIQQLSTESVERVAGQLLETYHSNHSIYIFGNGGSAATASHFACDLSKNTCKDLPRAASRIRAIALTENVATMTAWANDESYDDIFSEQLLNFARSGDCVIAISGSGKSRNVLNGLKTAKQLGAMTIGFGGGGGGEMRDLCRECVIAPSDDMELIEDIHLAMCHAVTSIVRERIAAGEISFDWAGDIPMNAPLMYGDEGTAVWHGAE